jgi:hypothetical protein
MWQLVQGHAVAGGGVMITLGVISLVVTVLLLPIWVARLPADHFSQHRVGPTRLRTLPHVALRAAKNTLGAVLVFLGLLMLVLPGQGLLTILRFPANAPSSAASRASPSSGGSSTASA